MAQNPNPSLALTTLTGVTRTLDDWATIFNLSIVMLPARAEASAFVPVIKRLYATLGDSDVRTAVWIPSTAAITRRILGDIADQFLTFCDPDSLLANALQLERLPAFVHLRQDTTLAGIAQGWSPSEWQGVADEIAKHVHWIAPVVRGTGNPAPSPGWAISA